MLDNFFLISAFFHLLSISLHLTPHLGLNSTTRGRTSTKTQWEFSKGQKLLLKNIYIPASSAVAAVKHFKCVKRPPVDINDIDHRLLKTHFHMTHGNPVILYVSY